MSGRLVIILIFCLIVTDLVCGTPKLEKRPAKKWMRQGLPESVEDLDLLKNHVTTHQNFGVESDPGTDNENVDDDLNQNQNDDQQNNDKNGIESDIDNAGKDNIIENQNEYEDDNVGQENVVEEQNDYENISQKDVTDNQNDFEDDHVTQEVKTENQNDVEDENVRQEDTEENQNDNDTVADGENSYSTRALQAGDVFSAQEMLPIAEKLMRKVDNVGEGKGIISSAFHPKVLADTLFERFFLVMKRIVVLEAIDIPGLDALQALALSGEVAGLRSASSVTESPANKRGEHLVEENPIRKCSYKLLRKRVFGNKRLKNPKNPKRRRHQGIRKLTNKLNKNRKLVINPRRGAMKKTKNKPRIIKGLRQSSKNKTGFNNRVQPKSKKTCRWMYECTDKTNLETCRLHSDCSEQAKYDGKYIGIKLRDEEHTDQLKQFRRAIAINVIDEEVEKILENRFNTLRPQRNIHPDMRVESLADYFNHLMMREQTGGIHTSPHPLAVIEDETTEAYADALDENENVNPDDELQSNREYQPEQGSEAADEGTVSTNEEVAPEDAGVAGATDAATNEEDEAPTGENEDETKFENLTWDSKTT